MKTKSYAAEAADKPLAPLTIDRREPGPHDVVIDVLFSGVCHSDIHQARGDWGNSKFPMVPGHEVIGRVAAVGPKVTKVKQGALVGVGCMTDSCRSCGQCTNHHEQFCEAGTSYTYNSTEMDRVTPTYGGYSTQMVVVDAAASTFADGGDAGDGCAHDSGCSHGAM